VGCEEDCGRRAAVFKVGLLVTVMAVASNKTEDGRAKNRRVKLVEN